MIGFTLQWHITQRCENHCKHCYMDNDRYDLPFKDFLLCLDNIQESENNDFLISSVVLTGGDPLLNPDWYAISRELVKRGKKLSILGNPETLSAINIAKLSNLNLRMFQLSLDGLRETHDRLRYDGSFKKTIDAIHLLSKYRIPIGIMFTISGENENELLHVIDYLDSLNVNIGFSFDFLIEIGHARENSIVNSVNKGKCFTNYIQKKEELKKKGSKLILFDKPSQLFAFVNSHYG